MGRRQRRERREALRQLAREQDLHDDLTESPEELAHNRRINRLLREHFPELQAAYDDPQGWDDDTGPHVFYAWVFYPFLEQVLMNEPDESPLLDRLYAFLRFLDGHDEEYGYLATVGVGEFLLYSGDLKALERVARDRLGPNMRSFLDEV